MELLKKLDAAYATDPNPDAVASIIQHNGWFALRKMTEDYFEKHGHLQHVIGSLRPDDEFQLISMKWIPKEWDRRYHYLMENLATANSANYYLILTSEFTEGSRPVRLAA